MVSRCFYYHLTSNFISFGFTYLNRVFFAPLFTLLLTNPPLHCFSTTSTLLLLNEIIPWPLDTLRTPLTAFIFTNQKKTPLTTFFAWTACRRFPIYNRTLIGEYKCADYQFKCGDGICLHQALKCDGTPQCTDHSDEKDCGGTGGLIVVCLCKGEVLLD